MDERMKWREKLYNMPTNRCDDFDEKLDFSHTSLSMSNSLVEQLGIASDFVGESIPVLEEGSFIGAITEGDLFTEVLNIEESLREEETVR